MLRIDEIREMAGSELLCDREEERISCISIDSRNVEEGTLFVSLVGKKVDAYRFLEPMITAGVEAIFTAKALTEARHETVAEAGTAVIHMADTLVALRAFAGWLRSRLSLPLTGMIGSVSKITTRKMIAAALSARYRVFKTRTNHNSQIGIPLTLLDIENEETGVIEMGVSRPGRIYIISELVYPATAVVTNIGTAYPMELGSRENIRDEKLKTRDDVQRDALLFRNAGDAVLFSDQVRGGITACTYGSAEGMDCRVENVGLVNGCAESTANMYGKRVAMKLGMSGEHQVSNVLAALGVTEVYSVPLAEAAAELERFKGCYHRQQISEHDGMLVTDGSYNANPASTWAALSTLHEIKSRRHIAVLGDMKELGKAEKELHWEIGAEFAAAKEAECLYTPGGLAAELVAACRKRYGADYHLELCCFSDRESFFAALEGTAKPGDVLLFKTSNGMRFLEPADYFSGQGGQKTH